MITASAQIWNCAEDECRVENSVIFHDPSGQQLSFAKVVGVAAGLPAPGAISPEYKTPDAYKIIGTSVKQLDHPDMVTGQAVYASDITLPDMLHAVLARCPVPSGKLVSYNAWLDDPVSVSKAKGFCNSPNVGPVGPQDKVTR